MKHVITLVAPSVGPDLESDMVDDVAAAIRGRGIETASPLWLAPGRAAEMSFAGEAETVHMAAAEVLADRPVDMAVIPFSNRRKKLLVADMDSTIITVECIDELADFAGIREEIAAVTERAMRGELDFEEALIERVAHLKGLADDMLARAYKERVRLSDGARSLVQTMRANGAWTVLVSGGFTFFAERVGKAAGFDRVSANVLEIANGHLTGTVKRPILGADAKLATLEKEAHARHLALADTIAIGDGANDIPMIAAAGLGIAYRPKPKTAAAADAVIRYGDLSTALFYQGYSADEIIS